MIVFAVCVLLDLGQPASLINIITSNEEILPGAPPFSRGDGFGVFPSKYRCLCCLQQQGEFPETAVKT